MDHDAEARVEAMRRELEAQYAQKRRDAALKEKRMRDRLQQDQQEWTQHKAAEQKRLADLAETLRRREENAARQAQVKKEASSQLRIAKATVDDERAKLEAQRSALERRVAELEAAVRARRRGARLAGLFVVAGGAVLVVRLASLGSTAGAVVAAAVAVVGGVLVWQGFALD